MFASMTSEERTVKSVLKNLNFKLFIGECAINDESKSGMVNQILTERYSTRSDQTKKVFLEMYEKSIKTKP